MNKEEREIIVGKLRKLTVTIPFEDVVAEKDKEGIREKLKGARVSIEEICN
jgi:hypothetical protein